MSRDRFIADSDDPRLCVICGKHRNNHLFGACDSPEEESELCSGDNCPECANGMLIDAGSALMCDRCEFTQD